MLFHATAVIQGDLNEEEMAFITARCQSGLAEFYRQFLNDEVQRDIRGAESQVPPKGLLQDGICGT